MNKINQKILLFFLFSFSIYCALIIGQTWDENANLIVGKITLDYLFSLGNIDKYFFHRTDYSSIYWSLQYLLTKIFPSQYQTELSHLINLIFSISAIIGIGKISKILFNKKVGQIVFLILFFYPIFFGHMGFNNKDTILAFSHVWISYLVLTYLIKQNIRNKAKKCIIFIGILAALSTGIQLVFLGSLIPIFLFIFVEIFFHKKFINKNFNKKKFFYDLIRCFTIFYLLLILFWIDVHPNILVLPISIILETFNFSTSYWTGYPYNLVNGNYYLSHEVPKSYLLINFFYKTPEYILITYLFFIVLLFSSKNFFKKKFRFFNYKLSLLILILIFPNLILFIIPYPLYDGMRLFLWTIPYFCIIPGLTIYYLIENFYFIKPKVASLFLTVFIIYFLFNFFSITPYQYTYLNLLNGDTKNRHQKFEGDYWGSTISELIKNSNFEKDKTIIFSTCGINHEIPKNYLKKKGYFNFMFVNPNKADYIIMTNRVVLDNQKNNELAKLTNCFDKFKGNDVFQVKRNNLLLSAIRKIN